MRLITSLYWNNISPEIVNGQKQAVEALGLQIVQCEETGTPHSEWMDRLLDQAADDDLILFLDIDCVPLNRAVVERAFKAAEEGRVFAIAQCGEGPLALAWRPDGDTEDPVYAAPAFLCVKKSTWVAAGRVSMAWTGTYDVGQAFTAALRQRNMPIELLMPGYVCRPQWLFTDRGCEGFGTFYEGDVFHLFQARYNRGFDQAFHYVADCVARRQRIDYILLHAKMNSFGANFAYWRARMRKKFLPRFLKTMFFPREEPVRPVKLR